MRYYIATGYARKSAHAQYRGLLDEAGYFLTSDWTKEDFAADRIGLTAAAAFDMSGVLNADLIVVLLPGAFGTHTELGMAIASGKRVVVVADGISASEAFAETMETCPFYFCDGVTRLDGIDAFAAWLTDQS